MYMVCTYVYIGTHIVLHAYMYLIEEIFDKLYSKFSHVHAPTYVGAFFTYIHTYIRYPISLPN